jgi:hypothetical protein
MYLLAHRGESGQRLDELAANETLVLGLMALTASALATKFSSHVRGEVLAQSCLDLGSVEIRNAEGGSKGRVEEAAGVARHEDRALLRVGGHVRGGQVGNLGAREASTAQRMLSVCAKQHPLPILEPRLPS